MRKAGGVEAHQTVGIAQPWPLWLRRLLPPRMVHGGLDAGE